MHPLYDASKLTDDEIIDRLGKANSYLFQQKQLGHNPTVESIKAIIDALEIEKQTRIQKSITEEIAKHIPDMNKPITLGKIQDEDKK